jgi:phosphoglycolate phosphatase
LLFDLDGTLTDPQAGITRCIQHALTSLGMGSPPIEELNSWIGPPIQDSFSKFLVSPSRVEEAVALFRERFAEVGMFENEVYPGIPEALEVLKLEGYRLIIATSKPQIFASRILDHFALAPFFESVFGSQLDGALSNKGELIAEIGSVLHLQPANCCMVGDRSHDVEGANKNGIPCIGVLYGYGSAEELLEAGAVGLCQTPPNLADGELWNAAFGAA